MSGHSYGGIWETADDESGGRDYTLQSFFSLALDKMDHFVCLRDDDIQEHEWNESESSSDEDDDDGSDSGSSSESEDGQADASGLQDAADPSTGTAPVAGDASVEDVEEEKVRASVPVALQVRQLRLPTPQTALRQQAEAFMGVSKQTERSEEDVMSTPLPGETLTTFYNRTKQVSRSPLSLVHRLTSCGSTGRKKRTNRRINEASYCVVKVGSPVIRPVEIAHMAVQVSHTRRTGTVSHISSPIRVPMADLAARRGVQAAARRDREDPSRSRHRGRRRSKAYRTWHKWSRD